MKKKESIVKLVSGCIEDVVSTTENIHRKIAEKKLGDSKSGFQEGGKRKKIYDKIKEVNSVVGKLVTGLLK